MQSLHERFPDNARGHVTTPITFSKHLSRVHALLAANRIAFQRKDSSSILQMLHHAGSLFICPACFDIGSRHGILFQSHSRMVVSRGSGKGYTFGFRLACHSACSCLLDPNLITEAPQSLTCVVAANVTHVFCRRWKRIMQPSSL